MVRYNFKKITVVPNGKDFIDITEKKKTERDLEANDEWKEDVMPEILDGHNRYDFIDPDILQRLEELRREESTDTDSDLDDCEIDGEELKPEEKDFVTAVRRNMIIRVPMKFDMDNVGEDGKAVIGSWARPGPEQVKRQEEGEIAGEEERRFHGCGHGHTAQEATYEVEIIVCGEVDAAHRGCPRRRIQGLGYEGQGSESWEEVNQEEE